MPRGCWAYQLATGRLKHIERYKDGFAPAFIQKELHRNFGKNNLIFVADMGDLFGEWVPKDWILRIIERVWELHPSNQFLFLTKNPRRYSQFIPSLPDNVILGVTIETNRNIRSMGLTRAPEPIERFDWMRVLPWHHKFVAVEPIMDFDLGILLNWIELIEPEAVAVGYDNYNCGLPEPELSKTQKLIEELEKFTEVWRKTLRAKHQ